MSFNNTKCIKNVLQGEKMDNKSIIDKVIKDFYESGHLSESILKNYKDVKEERLIKIYRKQGE